MPHDKDRDVGAFGELGQTRAALFDLRDAARRALNHFGKDGLNRVYDDEFGFERADVVGNFFEGRFVEQIEIVGIDAKAPST